MTRQTQGLLLAFLGAVLLRLAFSDTYLRYVTDWMKWPIVISGLLLLLLALGPILQLGEHRESRPDGPDEALHDHVGAIGSHSHPVPAVTWLLVLPGLVTFLISPPELGSYLAERRSGDTVAVAEPAELADLDSSALIPINVSEFIWRAQDGGESLEDQQVLLTGFVSYDPDGDWFVTRMSIGCCAADALAFRVRATGAERPPRDQWIEATGVYVPGTGIDQKSEPELDVSLVSHIEAPKQPYE